LKAIVYTRYGSPEVLSLQDVAMPVPKEDEVLVKVRAASINSWDWDMVRGSPWIVRAWGLTGPRHKIPGADIAGVVESVGGKVTTFKPGDEVFGDLCECGWGGYAQYACAREGALALKGKTMTFEQAAATPQAGLMALQGVFDKGNLKQGQKILMNGAGGGVGTFVIQMAKSLGAEITAVDSANKLEFLRSLGADHTIDYHKEDFTNSGKQYDIIIDVVAKRSAFDYKRALTPTGALIIIGGDMSVLFGTMLLRSWLSSKGGRQLGMLAYKPNYGLDRMIRLFEDGTVLPVIDSVYAFKDVPEAFRHFSNGGFKGKVVIRVD
jgi:NADPH:quinone reductase-like Zn-dependent oxidoreductase